MAVFGFHFHPVARLSAAWRRRILGVIWTELRLGSAAQLDAYCDESDSNDEEQDNSDNKPYLPFSKTRVRLIAVSCSVLLSDWVFFVSVDW